MKQKIYSLMAMVIAIVMASCSSQEAKFSGVIEGYSGCEVSLMDALKMDGVFTPMEVAADGSFEWTLTGDSAHVYYVLFSNPKSGFQLYTEPGMTANLRVAFRDDEEHGVKYTRCDVTYEGDNRDAFEFLDSINYQQVQNKVLDAANGNNWSFDKFRSELRREVDLLEEEINKVESKMFRTLLNADFEQQFVGSLFWYPELGDPKDKDFRQYIESLDRNSDKTVAISYATTYRDYYLGENGQLEIFRQLPTMFTNNETVQHVADYLLMQAIQESATDIETILAAYKEVKGENPIPEGLSNMLKDYQGVKIGSEAPDFEMKDGDGKSLQLSDLRGKYLYIDVWATWCGPCKMEIPHMERLHAHYKGNSRIALVSISIDTDTDAWKKKIENDHPEWAQYIVENGGESDLCKLYHINGIPRFMLIDSNGRIVDANAPRPSADNIIKWMDSHIK